MQTGLKFCHYWVTSLHWIFAVTTAMLQMWKYSSKPLQLVSWLSSLGHPLILLLVPWSFLYCVTEQNIISFSILCYSFSLFSSLSHPYFLFCLPLDHVSEYDEFKGHPSTDYSQFDILTLHQISPMDIELKCNGQDYVSGVVLFVCLFGALNASRFCCVA